MYYYRQINKGNEYYATCDVQIVANGCVEITEEEYNEAIAALETQDEPTDDEATAEDFEDALRELGVIGDD